LYVVASHHLQFALFMEEGSLLQEALQSIRERRLNGQSLQPRLVVDLYLLDDVIDRREWFQSLVLLCQSVNNQFGELTKDYRWYSGGEGPIFGVHVSSGVAHLRGECLYGHSVLDEWAMVGAVFEISKRIHAAIRFWDTGDGQILLIESSQALPLWVDQIGPSSCEFRCWVLNGEVTLVCPTFTVEILSLNDALQLLREGRCLERIPAIQDAIQRRLSSFQFASKTCRWPNIHHRTAILLPRKVAELFQETPSLLSHAVSSFEECSSCQPPKQALPFEDLVWTTQILGRTSYALLRSIQTSFWTSEDFIPSIYKSSEVSRMKRMCQNESTKHLRYALQLGVRVHAGLDYIMTKSKVENISEITAEARILHHWTKMDVESGGNGSWLHEAWHAGPNQSAFDLSAFLSCPIQVLDLVESFKFPTKYPGKALQTIIKQTMSKKTTEVVFIIPRSIDVDDDQWMHVNGDGDETLLEALFPPQKLPLNSIDRSDKGMIDNTQFDELINTFDQFLHEKSDYDGVTLDSSPITIDPKLYLNLLHKVLTSSPEEISNFTTDASNDPYFDDDDFELNADKDDEEAFKDINLDPNMENVNQENEDDLRNLDHVEVISGLMESLMASEGDAGPVRNIFYSSTMLE
jgi:SGT1 protein